MQKLLSPSDAAAASRPPPARLGRDARRRIAFRLRCSTIRSSAASSAAARTSAGETRAGAGRERAEIDLLPRGHSDRRLVRQVLGAVAQFEKATLVDKLAAARRRNRWRMASWKGPLYICSSV